MTPPPLQVQVALLEAATPDAIELPHGHLGPLVNNQVVPLGTGLLQARLFPLQMELSSSGLRSSKSMIILGLHFPQHLPASLTRNDVLITLEDSNVILPRLNVSVLPVESRGYIISATLPDQYLGKV